MSRRTSRTALLSAAAAIAATLPAHSQEHAHRQAGAHVHGAAEFSFVVSGDELSVAMDSPLANILGFEHAPGSAAERKAADEATVLLNDPNRIASPSPAAQCTAAKPGVVLPFDAKAKPHAAAPDAEDAHAGHAHMDIEASYTFVCKDIGRLTQIDVTAFKAFPGIKTADAIFIGPRAQLSRQLSPSSPTLRLK